MVSLKFWQNAFKTHTKERTGILKAERLRDALEDVGELGLVGIFGSSFLLFLYHFLNLFFLWIYKSGMFIMDMLMSFLHHIFFPSIYSLVLDYKIYIVLY